MSTALRALALSVVLFARIDPARLLEHSLRRGLLDRVRAEPGLTLREASCALGVDPTTVRHHARALARAGHLVLAEDGRARRLYPPGVPRARPAPAPRVVLALRAVRDGAGTPAGLARALDVPRGTAGSLLLALEKAGLVERREGRARLSERARRHLAPRGDDRAA